MKDKAKTNEQVDEQEKEAAPQERIYTEEELDSEIFSGGPTRRQVEEWKKDYKGVYFTPFEKEVYVWRKINRSEYRSLIEENKNGTTMDREDKITVMCTLWPPNLTIEDMITVDGGVPSLLSEMIMQKSGFVAQSAPITL